MRLYLLLFLLVLSGCSLIPEPIKPITVDVRYEATVLDKNNLPLIGKDYNVESYKMRDAPMLRTYNWQIRTTDKNGKLHYYVNHKLSKGEILKICILQQCTDISFLEAAGYNSASVNISKTATVYER